MKSQQWFEDKIMRIKSLSFRLYDPEIMPELERLLFEVKDALVKITLRDSEQVVDLIIDHMLVSHAERMAIYDRYHVPKKPAFACLQM